jgi:hypothetical protein
MTEADTCLVLIWPASTDGAESRPSIMGLHTPQVCRLCSTKRLTTLEASCDAHNIEA